MPVDPGSQRTSDGPGRPRAPAGSFAALAARILGRPPRLGPVRLVAVDGPSGAGKSRFAASLAAAAGFPVVHTDDLLDGWADQFTFWERLEAQVLQPLRQGRAATYRPYLWDSQIFGGPPITIEPAAAVVLEGVSAARRVIRPELSFAVFVTAPADLRWQRVIARDGRDDVAFRAYLERWRVNEDEHFAADATAAHADLVVDGAADATAVHADPGVDGAAAGSGVGYQPL